MRWIMSTAELKGTIQALQFKVLVAFDDMIADMISNKETSHSSQWAIYWV